MILIAKTSDLSSNIRSNLESAGPLQTIDPIWEPQIGGESLLRESIFVYLYDSMWQPVTISLSESAKPLSGFREVPPESDVDEFEFDLPLLARGRVRLIAKEGDWPLPDWEY